ncbi:MAG TPA: DUF4105 domain-containing protein, partial [Longimicrobiales bacterium]|nr:DUF4105 domain-containing protein [Longimicrobiales bacterium]
MGQGDLVYERFGHNAIWIHDPLRNTDLTYNWGTFDFEEPGFIQRFLQGRMYYWVDTASIQRVLYNYSYFRRTVWAQELNLTAAQKRALQEFATWNVREENKRYLYDYYRDNCSTRVRDVLDRALGGQLKQDLEAQRTETTYRSHTRRLVLPDVPLLTGMDLAMGPNIDRPLTAWDEGFIPMELQKWARRVRVRGPNGEDQPLVLNEQTLFDAQRAPPPDTPPPLLARYVVAGLLIAGVLALFGLLAARRWAQITFLATASVWSLVVGLLGTIIALLWALTDHVVTYRNENLLQANPVSLVLLVALIALFAGRRWSHRFAARTSVIVAGLSVLGLLIQLMPGVDQANGNIIALLLPAHLIIAWVVSRKPLAPPPRAR